MLFKSRKTGDAAEDQRQKAIAYKRVFGTEEGRTVLFDLLNRYHVLNPMPVAGLERAEGQRSVVIDILTRCHVDIAQLDKLLRGEI